MCEKCEKTVHEFKQETNLWSGLWSGKQDNRCTQCNRALQEDFKYCPYCGKAV